MSKGQSVSVAIADVKQRWKETLGMRREQYSTMLKSCEETKSMFEELRGTLGQKLQMDKAGRARYHLDTTMALWTLDMSWVLVKQLSVDNNILELAVTDSLDLMDSLVAVSRELVIVRQRYGETVDAKRQLAELNKKITRQTRKYGKVLRFLEVVSEKAKEQQRSLQKGLSYVE